MRLTNLLLTIKKEDTFDMSYVRIFKENQNNKNNTYRSLLTCEELVRREELVPNVNKCEDTIPNPQTRKEWIPNPHICKKGYQSTKEGKDQESIESSTTPYPGYQWESTL